MSLVNDMLRDLDQRRQEPGRSGFGAERLIPAVEERAAEGSRSLFSFALAIVISLLVIVGGFYFWQSRTVIPPVVEPAFIPNVPTAASQLSSEPQIDSAELESMARRMQELEAQNRALMDAQAALSAQTAAATETEPMRLPSVQERDRKSVV